MSFPPLSLAVVVVNYGSSALLEENLAPLSRALSAAGNDSRTVVVDNLTDLRERDRVIALAARESWIVVLPASNLGFGAGINAGVARAMEDGATTFLLLNPDARIAPDQVAVLVELSRWEPMTMLSPRILRPDGTTWFTGADLDLGDGRIRASWRRGAGENPRLVPWLSGACLVLSRRLWEIVGGFAEEYFLYWEDVDLSYRVHRAGGSVKVLGDVVAVHSEGGTQGPGHEAAGGPKSATYYYYNIRNRMLFAARNLTSAQVRSWRRRVVPVAYEVLLQGGRRQFLRPVRPVGAAWRGIRDALRIGREELGSRRAPGAPKFPDGGGRTGLP